MTQNTSHLHPDLRHLLTADLRTRIRAIKKPRWISYPRADEALALLGDIMDTPINDRMDHLIVWGDTNSGKTSILKRYFQLNPPNDNPDGDAVHYPVLRLQLPEKPDLRSFYSDVLRKMHATYRSSNTVGNLRIQAIDMLENCGVRMLMIDEFHNALRAGPNTQEQIFVLIRYLGNELCIPVVCSGLDKAVLSLQADSQLENRFEAFHLPFWNNDLTFRKFLHDYSKVLPLAEDSKIATTGLADLIFEKTPRTVGEFVKLLKKSAIAALKNDQEFIDEFAIENSGYIHPDKRRKQVEDQAKRDKLIRLSNAEKALQKSA